MAEKATTPQQLDFLQRYLTPKSSSYGNAYASAKGAGYSESYSRSITDQAPWLSELLGKSELVTDDEIILGIKAETTTDKSTDRLKAWELLGKYRKLFTDKLEHSGEMTHKFEELPDDELDRAIKARQDRIS